MKDDNSKVDSDNRNLLILGFSPLILLALGFGCAYVPAVAVWVPFLLLASVATLFMVLLAAVLLMTERSFSLGWKLLALSLAETILVCGGVLSYLIRMD